MEFKYNNLSYWFSDKESLADMLKREDVLSFPLSVWKELLEHRYGLVNKDTLITVLKAKIEAYDISSSVNGFYVKGLNFWLDKATRVGLMHLANCSTNTILLVLGTQVLTIPIDTAKTFLSELEVYAGLCYLLTQKHLLAILLLKTVEDIINYDYTKGYPSKITFNA